MTVRKTTADIAEAVAALPVGGAHRYERAVVRRVTAGSWRVVTRSLAVTVDTAQRAAYLVCMEVGR